MRFSSHFKFSYIYISRFFFNYYIIIVSTMPTFFFNMLVQKWHTPGADPGFQVGGGRALKKMRGTEGGAKMFGVFHVKNHDFTPKNHIFSNFGRGSVRQVHPPPLDLPLMYMITSFFVLIVGWSFSFHGKCLADEISKSRSFIICRYCLTCWGACCNMCML